MYASVWGVEGGGVNVASDKLWSLIQYQPVSVMVLPGKQPSPEVTEEGIIRGLFTERGWYSENQKRKGKIQRLRRAGSHYNMC